ncbi:aspartyl protease family protein, partial [Pseudomonas proteolytica]|uniref:aspartyl protease family protein n=1 Tax=Pseudomonas proteolytica TaxID=219574 RepID=UPI0030DB2776
SRARYYIRVVNTLPDLGPQGSLYLLVVAVVAVMVLARRVPVIGRFLAFAVTAGCLVLVAVLLMERAPLDPTFARVAQRFELGGQRVVGKEMRVPMAADGHFWVRVKLGGIERRMLVDSGATVTAISADTAAAAGIEPSDSLMPVMMQTA